MDTIRYLVGVKINRLMKHSMKWMILTKEFEDGGSVALRHFSLISQITKINKFIKLSTQHPINDKTSDLIATERPTTHTVTKIYVRVDNDTAFSFILQSLRERERERLSVVVTNKVRK